MKKLLFLLLIVSLLFACKSSNKNNSENIQSEIENKDWKTYSVSYPESGELPPIKFTFKYPDREGIYVFDSNSYNYARLVAQKNDKDSTFLYTISFGYCKNCHYDKETAFYLLNSLFGQFQISIANLENDDLYVKNLFGKECFVSQNTFSLDSDAVGFKKGDYLFEMIIYPPDKPEIPNGLLLLITAEKNNSEYKTFDDLTSKGEIAGILKSIEIKK